MFGGSHYSGQPLESSSHSNPTLELFTHSPTHSDIQVEITVPSFVSFTAPNPSPCLCRESECQKERDGNGVENETDREASGNVEFSEDTHGQLWAKFDKLYRGLSDPGFEPQQTTFKNGPKFQGDTVLTQKK